MSTLNCSGINCGLLRTVRVNIGQVDHFDWEWCKYLQMTKPKKSQQINDSLSAVIQISGESSIFIHQSARVHIINTITGDVQNYSPEDAEHCQNIANGFISVHDLMETYEIPDIEERSLITLRPGHMLVMFGSTTHGSFAAINLDSLRAHLCIPVTDCPVMSESVSVLRSNSGVMSKFFR